MPKFNLSARIDAFNKANNQKISLTEDWGLEGLSAEDLGFLEKAESLLTALTHSSVAIEKARALQLRLKGHAMALSISNQLKWEQNLEQFFSKRFNWILWRKEKSEDEARHRRLSELEELWQHTALHFQSNETLIRLHIFINSVLAHLRIAQTEFEKRGHRLPKPLAVEYQKYLSDLWQRFSVTHNDVLHAMCNRLLVAGELAQKSGKFCGDVVSYTAAQLKQESIEVASAPVSGYRHPFVASTFNTFHQVLHQHADSNLRRKMEKILWLQETAWVLPTKLVTLNKQPYVVPAALAKHMPGWIGSPAWLFAGRHARAKFIVEHQQAIAQLKVPLPKLPKELSFKDQKNFLQLVTQHESCVKTSLDSLQNIKPSAWQWGYGSLLSDWRKLNEERLQSCAEKRLVLLDAIAKKEEAKDVGLKLKQWQIIRPVLQQLQTKNLPLALQQQLNPVYKKLQDKLGQHPTVYAADQLEMIAKGKPVKLQDKQLILEVFETLELSGIPKDSLVSQEMMLGATQKLKVSIQNQFVQEMVVLNEILTNARLFQLLGKQEDMQSLQSCLESWVFRNYLAVFKLPEKDARKYVELLEQLVMILGKPLLQEAARNLKEKRSLVPWADYLSSYRDMIDEIAASFTDKYSENEVVRVESYLAKCVQQTTQDVDERRLLAKLSDRLADQQRVCLAEITLAPYEKILSGLQGAGERNSVREAIEITAAARIFLPKIKAAKASYEKDDLLHQLKHEVVRRAPKCAFFEKHHRIPPISILEKRYASHRSTI